MDIVVLQLPWVSYTNSRVDPYLILLMLFTRSPRTWLLYLKPTKVASLKREPKFCVTVRCRPNEVSQLYFRAEIFYANLTSSIVLKMSLMILTAHPYLYCTFSLLLHIVEPLHKYDTTKMTTLFFMRID